MVIKPPKNIYEKEIYNLLVTKPEYAKYPDGEKSILYDLAVQDIPKYISFNWEDLCLDDYLYKIKLSYDKTKSQPCINVVCACIKRVFPEYDTELVGNIDNKKLVISGPYLFP